jgi:alpha-aminoadipic semialdehyde synthase
MRREDKNPWERRAPLIPTHVRELIRQHDLNVVVQPSEIRIFSDQEYVREGAALSDELSECKVIMAIKEIPIGLIESNKVYCFFSHTIKGQLHNRPMLKRLKEQGCTLIDYEKICDQDGRRLLFFGTQAGQAGMVETLSALGRRLSHEGIRTPFSLIEQPYRYGSLVECREILRKVGWEIHEKGLDQRLVPLVCGFKGYGRSSQGAQELFDLLPNETVAPGDLSAFFRSGNYSAFRVYKVVFKEEHMVAPKTAERVFDLQDYYHHPQRYRSIFPSYLPFMTMLINAIYWDERFPRFIPINALRELFSGKETPRLRIIGDISCDVGGSVEITRRVTTPTDPVFIFDPLTETTRPGHKGRGVVVMAIDNLPAEIPLESSSYFSGALKSFVPAIARADYDAALQECGLPPEIQRAVILYQGEFTSPFSYMKDFVK